ncbi:MAG: hypothetical protein O3C39_05735 [Planctomycetota bacterium]|jgi:hypothetical protein|nr:hypothetical protein [Planctomycetota bacterium]MDA1201167.1 hypothetical protein [Planctomycetota bacterium]
MSEQIGAVLIFAGLLAATVGFCWLLGRGLVVLFGRREARALLVPLAVLGGGLVLGATPFAYQRLHRAIVGFGERERVIDGERAIVLTDWDRNDYSLLAERPDTVILEMGNPDVTDETLELLLTMSDLRELTLNDSAITDAGLATLARLPTIEALRLARTKITPEGLERFLETPPVNLRMIDVSGNGIPARILRAWKNAAPDGEERRYVD